MRDATRQVQCIGQTDTTTTTPLLRLLNNNNTHVAPRGGRSTHVASNMEGAEFEAHSGTHPLIVF